MTGTSDLSEKLIPYFEEALNNEKKREKKKITRIHQKRKKKSLSIRLKILIRCRIVIKLFQC